MDRVRKQLASLVLATSTLAHGYWRAGSKLHNVFGGLLIVLIAIAVLPVMVFRRIMGKKETKTHSNDEQG